MRDPEYFVAHQNIVTMENLGFKLVQTNTCNFTLIIYICFLSLNYIGTYCG